MRSISVGLVTSIIVLAIMFGTGFSPGEIILNLGQQTNLGNVPNARESPVLTEPQYRVAENSNVPELKEPSNQIAELEEQIHELTNHYRDENGLKTLSFNPQLANIARGHSEDMAAKNYFSHTNLQDEDPTGRAEKAGFHCHIDLGNGWYVKGIAENIWQGWTYSHTLAGVPVGFFTSNELAKEIVDGWMNSPGHRKNILTEFLGSEGIGVAITQDGKVYATQDFC